LISDKPEAARFAETIEKATHRRISAVEQIKGDYERAYYAGIIWERLGHAYIRQGGAGGGASAYHPLREAMTHYERAIEFAPPGNDDAILRWNTCARVIMHNTHVRPRPKKTPERSGRTMKRAQEPQTRSIAYNS
jgi:hypothetical protein